MKKKITIEWEEGLKKGLELTLSETTPTIELLRVLEMCKQAVFENRQQKED